MIAEYTKKKVPAFFKYAKDKPEEACEKKNTSVVNMLEDIIENKRMCFTAKDIGKFDYRLMMRDKDQYIDPDVIKRFIEMDGSAYRQISASNNDDESDFGYLKIQILTELALMAGSVEAACDMLIKELFARKTVAHKSTFWLCFGDIVYENLKNNIAENIVQCVKCGRRFVKKAQNQRLCEKCASRQKIEVKKHICIDCGIEFVVSAKNNKKVRCDACQREYRRVYKAKHEKARRKRAGAA